MRCAFQAERCPIRGRYSALNCPSSIIHFGCLLNRSVKYELYCNSNYTRMLVILTKLLNT